MKRNTRKTPAGRSRKRRRRSWRMQPSPSPKNAAISTRLVKYEMARTSAGIWRISESSRLRIAKERKAIRQAGVCLSSGAVVTWALCMAGDHSPPGVDGQPTGAPALAVTGAVLLSRTLGTRLREERRRRRLSLRKLAGLSRR
jgi:hypothetical protein